MKRLSARYPHPTASSDVFLRIESAPRCAPEGARCQSGFEPEAIADKGLRGLSAWGTRHDRVLGTRAQCRRGESAIRQSDMNPASIGRY